MLFNILEGIYTVYTVWSVHAVCFLRMADTLLHTADTSCTCENSLCSSLCCIHLFLHSSFSSWCIYLPLPLDVRKQTINCCHLHRKCKIQQYVKLHSFYKASFYCFKKKEKSRDFPRIQKGAFQFPLVPLVAATHTADLRFFGQQCQYFRI